MNAVLSQALSRLQSRPPSLPPPQTEPLCDLLSSLPRLDADKENTHPAREPVSDTCDGLHSLLRLMEFVQMSTIHGTEQLAHELGSFTADLPTQVALPVLLNAYPFKS